MDRRNFLRTASSFALLATGATTGVSRVLAKAPSFSLTGNQSDENTSKATQWPEHFKINYGVYALYLKDTYCGNIMYGRQSYDYQDGTIVSFALSVY